MKHFLKIHRVLFVAIILVAPTFVFAQVNNTCSSSGYTIETINGVFTDEKGARLNKQALELYFFEGTYNGEPLTIDFLLNKTHKILDITDTAIQKTFEGVDMWDPDFLKMLNDASTQVKTQKVLLVAHSQGNFYANNVYKVVTDDGDVSKKSIGVYGVASPASYVAGDGRHLTSSTDKVIAFLVENVLPGTIAPTNDAIDYKWSDDPMGHDFAKVYLEYRPKKIVDDIKWSLDKLSVDPTRSENTPCINPPKELSTVVKIISPVVYTGKSALIITIAGATTIKNTAVGTAVGTYNVAVTTAVWTYHTSIAVAVWSYNTTVAVGKAVGSVAITASSAIYNAIASALSDNSLASNNSASVILATQNPQASLPVVVTPVNQPVPLTSVVNQSPTAIPSVAQKVAITPALDSEVKRLVSAQIPKLVFVGMFGAGFGGGGGVPPQVLGTTITASEATTEPDVSSVGSGFGLGTILQTPALSVPQCAYSLATSTDGCLLATTTVRFEWAPISGASYYSVSENGVSTTTTDIALDITAPDFSDYTFAVAAVDAGGYASATSTQTVSIATIPIAINEIAWMGTVASTSAEWIEIKNNTGHTIDLSQWALASNDNRPVAF
ncbi:MAG: hypothetical protein HY939_07275 [Gammaproteobacteria bacterium]|nr:hypothetical protein [Gammaproteobacteria bacterium]